jgi:DNA-directed RNA polymerase subunit N (RpoN/RPB10)
MIIPVRCMNCGNVLADKWRTYQTEVARIRKMTGKESSSTIYMDATSVINTPEKIVLDKLGLRRYCCRKHFLTHVDLIEKI